MSDAATVHDLIWQHYQAVVNHDTRFGDQHTRMITQSEFLHQVFHNHTPQGISKRLTPLGFTVMSKMFQCWSLDLPKNWDDLIRTPGVILRLHNKIPSAFHWDRRCLYVFNSEIGLEFEMSGRDFESWLKMF